MKHSWSKIGTYKNLDGNNVQICKQCGIIQQTTRHGYKNFLTRFYRSELIAVKKTPVCDNIWPKNWRPTCVYTMVIGQWNYAHKYIVCESFDKAKEHIDKYGVPTDLKTNFFVKNECAYEFMLWLMEIDEYPMDFTLNIIDGRFQQLVKELDDKLKTSMVLANNLNQICVLAREQFYL